MLGSIAKRDDPLRVQATLRADHFIWWRDVNRGRVVLQVNSSIIDETTPLCVELSSYPSSKATGYCTQLHTLWRPRMDMATQNNRKFASLFTAEANWLVSLIAWHVSTCQAAQHLDCQHSVWLKVNAKAVKPTGSSGRQARALQRSLDARFAVLEKKYIAHTNTGSAAGDAVNLPLGPWQGARSAAVGAPVRRAQTSGGDGSVFPLLDELLRGSGQGSPPAALTNGGGTVREQDGVVFTASGKIPLGQCEGVQFAAPAKEACPALEMGGGLDPTPVPAICATAQSDDDDYVLVPLA